MVMWTGPASHGWVVALINGFGTVPRREAGESDLAYPAPASLPDAPAFAVDLPTATHVAVADRLHALFTADSAPAAARALDEVLVAAAPDVRVVTDGSGVRTAWAAADPADALLAAGALSLLEVVAASGDDTTRFGTCAGDRCGDVYVDRSPTRSRRFCSTTCQNRAKVAAFRSRQRGAAR